MTRYVPKKLSITADGQIGKPKQMPFIMKWWAKEYIILPPKYLDDLRRADKESLSFLTNISDVCSIVSMKIGSDFARRSVCIIRRAIYIARI